MKTEDEPNESQYFPKGIFSEDPRRDGIVYDWYASALKAFEEPSLWELSKSEKPHVYRFLWLPDVVVRLTIEGDGTASLTTKVTWENRARQSISSAEETAAFLSIVESAKFWDLPTTYRSIGFDGEQWVTEGLRNRRYHIVHRFSPEKGSYRELGLQFFQLAKLQLPCEELPGEELL